MTVRAAVVVDRGDFRLEASLEVGGGEVVALVGPNGAGKSTLLRAIAGLERLGSGRVEIDGVAVDDPASGVFVEPSRRRVGFVFQDYLLFPHLTVKDNIGFGRGAAVRAREWMDRLGVDALADRKPAEISGGQAQRVALARALAVDPAVLLLDEPLAALDVESRHEVRSGLRQHLENLGIPVVLVTHDPVDAALLADRMIVLEGGRVSQEGKLVALTSRPRSAWTARLAGTNLYRGTAEGHLFAVDGGGELALADPHWGPALATVAPRAVSVHLDPPVGSPRNVWSGTVSAVEPAGGRIRVTVAGAPPIVAEVTQAAATELDLAGRSRVWVSVKAAEIEVYPP